MGMILAGTIENGNNFCPRAALYSLVQIDVTAWLEVVRIIINILSYYFHC